MRERKEAFARKAGVDARQREISVERGVAFAMVPESRCCR